MKMFQCLFTILLVIAVVSGCEEGDRCRRAIQKVESKTFGSEKKGRCECALFSTKTSNTSQPGEQPKPLVSKESVEITCDKEGQDTCQKLCVEVAKAAQNQGPLIVCESVRDANKLLLKLSTRVCQENEWRFSGIESTEELCCKEGLPVPCEGAKEVPTSLTGSITDVSDTQGLKSEEVTLKITSNPIGRI